MKPGEELQAPDSVAIARWLDAQEAQNKQSVETLEAIRGLSGETKEAVAQMAEIHAQTAEWMREIRSANSASEQAGLQPGELFGKMIAAHHASQGNAEKTLALMSDRFGVPDGRMKAIENALSQQVLRDLSVQEPAAGGIIVPELVFDEMIPFFRFTATLFQLGCRMIQLSPNKTIIPRLLSGTTATWELENMEVGMADEPRWGTMEMTPHKLAVRLKMSNSWLAAGKSASQVLAMDAAAAYAQEWSYCAMNGNGVKRPMGLFHPKIKALITEYSPQTAYVDKRAFWSGFKKAFRKANKGQIGLGQLGWVFNEDVTCVLEGSETSFGTAKWNTDSGNILGIPFKEDFQLTTTDNTYDTTQIALADWSEMFIGTSRQVELRWSPHSQFGKDQTEMLLVGEGDCGPRQLKAFCVTEAAETVPH